MGSGLPKTAAAVGQERSVHHSTTHLTVGDLIAYVGPLRHYAQVVEPAPRDWLRISRFDEQGGIGGYRVHPEDWERDVEFVVVRRQITDNGVLKLEAGDA